MCDLRHHQAEWAGAGDHDHVVELDLSTIDGLDHARHRLDDRRVLKRDTFRNLMHDGSGGMRM